MFSLSELPFSEDGRIYHLNLLPHEIAKNIITVGDPGRVPMVSKYFSKIEHQVSHREFITHTGIYKGNRVSVISTGIGTPNIDIVLNELDVLVNVDFSKKELKSKYTSLNIIRLGTTGAMQEDIELGDLIISNSAIGFDGLLNFYKRDPNQKVLQFEKSIHQHFACELPIKPYGAFASSKLVKLFSGVGRTGITVTCPGFYGPQSRLIRSELSINNLLDNLRMFKFEESKCLNFEMETSAILGFGELLGHDCLSVATVLANRVNGSFAKNTEKYVDSMIRSSLDRIASL